MFLEGTMDSIIFIVIIIIIIINNNIIINIIINQIGILKIAVVLAGRVWPL